MSKFRNIPDKSNLCSPLGVRGSFLALFFLFLSISVFSQTSLYSNFKTPPSEARPWTFWYWMHGAVSKEGIRADLKAMQEIGLDGAYLMPIKGVEGSTYPKPVSQLTPEWWEMVRYSFQVADSLRLKIGMHISDGFALAGGPWIKPAESMQKVVFTDTIVKGGKITSLQLSQPEAVQNYYEDIAVYAFPVLKSIELSENTPTFEVYTQDGKLLPPSPQGEGSGVRSEIPCYIQYSFEKPFTLRNIEITPAGNNIQSQRLAVSASNDGANFRLVKQLVPPRQGWQNTGFNTTFSIPPTRAKYFRLSWTPEGSEPGSEDLDAAKWKPALKIKSIRLNSEPRINSWEGKSGLVWRIAEETSSEEVSTKECIPTKKLINLTSYLKEGKLTCKLPRGNWRIVRMGHTSTGLTNATGGGGKGLECDKFSEVAVQKQFDNWFGAAFKETDKELAQRVLKFMHIDSWECGTQNWSHNFATEFQARRGYDLMLYLPVLAGFPIESVRKSEQVLRDVRTTIGELVNDVFFKVMVRNAKAYGCEISAECVAPTMVSDGLLHFNQVDRPMGEFWLKSPTHDKPNDMLDAISGAHIYGKNIIQSESFTQLRTNWDEDPAMLKPLLDRNFALGINKVFFHIFVHNPYLDKAPGTTLDGIGLYFQRDQTWWKPGKAFVDYVARCQTLLQYGHPVTDIAVFTGEEFPRRAFTPDKLVPMLPGLVGAERVEGERKRLANDGQPMMEMPVGVNHSANMLKSENWINPLRGYAYDSFNKDALLRLARAQNGEMKLGDSTVYKVVVFPKGTAYSPEVQAKIAELKQAGVQVPELPLNTSLGFESDVQVPQNIAWTHRSGEMGDIYFISNQENVSRSFDAFFRNTKNKPTLWNAVTGEVEPIRKFERTENQTKVKLTLAPYESVFVVFSYKNEAVNKYVFLLEDSIPVNGKWDIRFPKNNQEAKQCELFDWSLSANLLIKYYSGTAVYKTTFNFKSDNIKQIDSRPVRFASRLAKYATLLLFV
ncbi:MAG: glycosyl hydrolase [Paludibacter sp.]